MTTSSRYAPLSFHLMSLTLVVQMEKQVHPNAEEVDDAQDQDQDQQVLPRVLPVA